MPFAHRFQNQFKFCESMSNGIYLPSFLTLSIQISPEAAYLVGGPVLLLSRTESTALENEYSADTVFVR